MGREKRVFWAGGTTVIRSKGRLENVTPAYRLESVNLGTCHVAVGKWLMPHYSLGAETRLGYITNLPFIDEATEAAAW